MPTYEYVCQACNHELEVFQRMSDSALRKCPACGKLKLRRRLGAGAGIIFRGSGFYETDYRRKTGGNGTSGGNGRTTSTEPKPEPAKAGTEQASTKPEKKGGEGGKD